MYIRKIRKQVPEKKMKELEENSMEEEDRPPTFEEVNSSPKRSKSNDSSIIQYLRATRSTRLASVQGSKIQVNGTTEMYVDTDNQSTTKVDESSQNNRRRTLRSIELQRNRKEMKVQGGNVKIKQEQLDLSLEETVKQTSDVSSDTMESSDEEESITELSDSSDNLANREEMEDEMDAEVAEIETKMRNSIAVNRKPWEGYGSSRKKIKKYYSDVSEYRKKSHTEFSIEEGDRTRNNEEIQGWENQTSLIHKLPSRTKKKLTTESVNNIDRTDETNCDDKKVSNKDTNHNADYKKNNNERSS